MRTEANLRRLAEIGVDAYRPRVSARTAPSHAHTAPLAAAPAPYTPAASGFVVLLAPAGAGEKLLVDVRRALAVAGVEAVRASAVEGIGRALALVAFGATQARLAGAAVPADRQREMEWIVAEDVVDLRGNGAAKRALWSELKRAVRMVRAPS